MVVVDVAAVVPVVELAEVAGYVVGAAAADSGSLGVAPGRSGCQLCLERHAVGAVRLLE